MVAMTTVMEQLRDWQAEGGPELWREAWDFTLALGEVPWAGMEMIVDKPVLADGAAALTVIVYITAAEQGIRPSDVRRAHVDAFRRAAADGAATYAEQQARWERRLTALGHDLHDPTDPVAAMWRRISIDYRPRDGAGDAVREDSFTRWGPGFVAGLDKVFAPAYLMLLA